MRTCISFMVVEYIRHGTPVQEACRLAIERLQRLPPSYGTDKMHTSLVVGIVAMDRFGNIGAASTLGATNLHRGAPYFPVSYWIEGDSQPSVLLAGIEGASP